ncbi:hypothetical protein DL766_002253 [Monosporascus sp. MC13-8B]|nr:hypothetical protein DL766_002253 [Monosporascus sp. MC13-8B]
MDSAVSIFSRVNESGTVFISLERALSNSSRFAAQVRPEDIKDEFYRFKIWAGNIAAHRKGRRSLEYRLRDAALLKDEVHKLLTALHGSLQTSIVQEKRRPWDELSDSESDSDSDAEHSDDAESQGDTELKQLLGSIKTTITCLFRLSMSIRDPAPNDQSRSIITVDKSHFEEYDMQHAKAKYPGCAGYLVERLGRANSGRRQYLSYREEHHQKLVKDIDLIGLEVPRTERTSNSTEVTLMPTVRPNSFGEVDSDDALSQTSYATSVNAAIRVPPLPKEAHEKEHYECPICFMIVSIHTAAGWKYALRLYHNPGLLLTRLALFALPLNLESTEDDRQDQEQEVRVRGRQDEELSDVSDTLDANEPASEEQVPLLLQRMDSVLQPERKEDDDVEEAGGESLENIEEEAGTTGVEPRPMSKELYDAHRPPRSGADAEPNRVPLSSLHSTAKEIHNDKDTWPHPKGILRKPTEKFPDGPNPDLEGVAQLGRNGDTPPGAKFGGLSALTLAMQELQLSRIEAREKAREEERRRQEREIREETRNMQGRLAECLGLCKILPGARRTEIARKFVDPEALEEAGEHFEERLHCFVVLRVLRYEEVQKLADRTKEIRESKEAANSARETASSKDISGSEEGNR